MGDIRQVVSVDTVSSSLRLCRLRSRCHHKGDITKIVQVENLLSSQREISKVVPDVVF